MNKRTLVRNAALFVQVRGGTANYEHVKRFEDEFSDPKKRPKKLTVVTGRQAGFCTYKGSGGPKHWREWFPEEATRVHVTLEAIDDPTGESPEVFNFTVVGSTRGQDDAWYVFVIADISFGEADVIKDGA
jgi:hypothetical protein